MFIAIVPVTVCKEIHGLANTVLIFRIVPEKEI